MANGAEALLKTLFKAMGFDPAEMASGLQGFIEHVYAKLDEFDRRMNAQEELMRQIVAMLNDKEIHDEQPSNIVALLPGIAGEPSLANAAIGGPDRATGTTGG